MRVLLAFILGAWLALAFIGMNPHTTSPGAIALVQILALPVVVVLTMVIIRRDWR
jgi:hypothetical protein